jgi:hypothetical protein
MQADVILSNQIVGDDQILRFAALLCRMDGDPNLMWPAVKRSSETIPPNTDIDLAISDAA